MAISQGRDDRDADRTLAQPAGAVLGPLSPPVQRFDQFSSQRHTQS
jgi:hypothetical protein